MRNLQDIFDSELISYETAAAIAGRSHRFVEEAVRRGELPAIKIGTRCVRLDKKVFDEFLRRRGLSPPLI